MMDYQDQEQKRRLKIIVIATIAAIVVLALGVWVIVAAVNSLKRGNNTEIAQVDSNELTTSQTIEEDEKDRQTNNPNASDPASQYTPVEATEPAVTEEAAPATTPAAPAAAPANTSEDIPSTGPSDTALAAVLVGVAAYLFTINVQLVKKQIAKQA